MSKKYIEKAFLIDRAMCHDNELNDYYLEQQRKEIGSDIVGLLADGQPYICELEIKTAKKEMLDGYVSKMWFSYEPLVRCGTCRFWKPMNSTVGRCGKHDLEMLQTDYCSYGEGISEFKVQI